MPAAAVIPAPLAYTIIVAVKRLVVGLNTLSIFLSRHTSFVSLLLTSWLCDECGAFSLNLLLQVRYSASASHLRLLFAIMLANVSVRFIVFNTVNKSECTKHVTHIVH